MQQLDLHGEVEGPLSYLINLYGIILSLPLYCGELYFLSQFTVQKEISDRISFPKLPSYFPLSTHNN